MAAGVLFDLERLASGAGRNLLEELDDSKRLARTKRERLAQAVLVHAVADILILALSFADTARIDPTAAVLNKLTSNAERYPLEKSRGRATKYTDL